MKLSFQERCVVVCFLALCVGNVFGQAPPVQTGTPPFGSFGGGPFDVVNQANLNVHFAIPIVHKAGRGMPFVYDLSYDSSVWQPASVSGQMTWKPAFNWGWGAQTAVATGYITYVKATAVCDWPPPKTGSYSIFSHWVYHDPYGASHAFGGTMESDSTNCDQGNTLTLGSVASDGSGLTLSASITSLGGLSTHVLTTPGGQVLNPPVNLTNGFGAAASTRTDANGNQISVSSSGVYTDTLNTTALAVTGQATPGSPLTLTYSGPNGLVAVLVHYANQSIKTNFGCSNVIDYPLTQVPLVSDVTFPDGAQYTFIYETTPGSGNSSYVTGRLQSVTLPTGGQINYTYAGGSNGINCADGSASGLTRQLSPGGSWTYARALVSGTQWTTTITDPTPQANQTVLNFQGILRNRTADLSGHSHGNRISRHGDLLQREHSGWNSVDLRYHCSGFANRKANIHADFAWRITEKDGYAVLRCGATCAN